MAHDLAIVGPLPPPYGGISIHVERMLAYLDREGVDYLVYNTSGPTEVPGRVVSVADQKYGWYLRYLLGAPEPTIYILSVKWPVWVGSWVLSRLRGKRVVINLQGDDLRVALEAHGSLVRRALLAALAAADTIIACNTHIRDHLVRLGDFAAKTVVIAGFIPPLRRDGDAEALSPEVRAFCRDHDPVILGNGSAVLRDGVDLYGIDLTLELTDRLRRRHPRLGVLWSLTDIVGSSDAYADRLRAEVARRGLGSHWLFSRPQPVFHPVYDLVDVLVRPTLSEGDALSVREALALGVPTVASDSAPRPEEAVCFASRDPDDFERAVGEVLDDLGGHRARLAHRPSDTGVEQEIALLRPPKGG